MYESFTDSRPAIESKKQVVIKGFKKPYPIIWMSFIKIAIGKWFTCVRINKLFTLSSIYSTLIWRRINRKFIYSPITRTLLHHITKVAAFCSKAPSESQRDGHFRGQGSSAAPGQTDVLPARGGALCGHRGLVWRSEMDGFPSLSPVDGTGGGRCGSPVFCPVPRRPPVKVSQRKRFQPRGFWHGVLWQWLR